MSCGSSCGTGGASACSKLNVFDWLQEMEAPKDGFDAVEVKFKGGRKVFYRNTHNLQLFIGDAIVVESSPGHDVGFVSATGEIVRLQMRKKKVTLNDDLNVIYRKATERDMDTMEQSKNRELTTLYRTREIVRELKLGMKMSDVEFQGDNTKAIFFYSAEDRVDFRELIKRLAGEFRIRVEMRQISLRQEAGRLGGIGSCGRELCCSSWLTNFKSVGTSAARYQNLSLNPSKLSGQCGRLKCCLNYELDTYIDALKDIPKVKGYIKTTKGNAKLQKTDIFKKKMWFSFEGDSNWYVVSAKRVFDLIELNKKDIIPHSLEIDEEEVVEDNGVLNSDISQLDKKYRNKKKQHHKKKNKKRQPQGENKQQKNNTQGKTNKQTTNNKKQHHSPKANTQNKEGQPIKKSRFKKRRPPKKTNTE